MARLTTLSFEIEYRYQLTSGGIIVPIELAVADRRITLPARLDTGSSDCLFDESFAQSLGMELEQGYRRTYQTVAGSFSAYGHEVTLRTEGLEWNALVFFYAAPDPEANFLGRRGWLDRITLGLTHYEQALYLAPFSR
jgi:Aspartyl protease